jgi:hypothetical protein
LVLVAFSSPASARTWVVDAGCVPPDGCDCREIQPCIDLAAAGDTVLVRAASYVAAEARTVDVAGTPVTIEANVFLKDGVSLVGEGAPSSTPGTRASGAADHLTAGTSWASDPERQRLRPRRGRTRRGMLCVASHPEIRGNRPRQTGHLGGALA